ncbi:Phosphatidylinositide phosphatase SAC1 [Gryllus bimaculatus]|nr:Phosphatidylinositide phosphatase SAC1 [Gryllus bimaculatus]
MDSIVDLYDDFILYITPEKFYIEAISGGNDVLVIDRVNHELSLQANHGQIPQASSSKPVCGIIGTVRLLAGPYLVVATKKRKVGSINGQAIWQIIETEVISYTRTLLHLTEKQISQNKVYVSMVEQVLCTPYLYFSYSYDLTHTLQRLHNTTPEFLQCSINGNAFTWTIVSRRCCFRAGTRLFTRGVDLQGNVANFVETEQIFEYNGDKCSFVQTRGSIPLFWNQLPNLRYKPKPRVNVNENHTEAFSRHFDTQIFNYGKQVIINLIDHRGAEDVLEKAYHDMVNRLGNTNIRYESFDFHAECRHMHWERLSILTDRLAHEQDEFGYFLITRDGTLVSQQDGIFRTNCIDCLDRTNVVQSMLARRSLSHVMEKLGILRPGQRLEDQLGFEMLFKQVWADNADVLSIEYSGTGALKTDFTRTGKRTKWGVLRDGINSLTRYYKNNFMDGFRQDSIDLFLGHYIIEDGEGVTKQCPLDVEKGWKYITFPLVLLVAIAMFFANVVTPSEYTTESLLYLLFWGSMVAVTFGTIMIYGTEFVDYPKLCEIRVSPRPNNEENFG